MEIGKSILVGIYAAIGLYLLYKLFFSRNPQQEEYEKLYKDVINSKKYKVKSQYDKD